MGVRTIALKILTGLYPLFFVTFGSEKDRAIYLPHPAHKAFGKILSPYLDKVLVIDYWTE